MALDSKCVLPSTQPVKSFFSKIVNRSHIKFWKRKGLKMDPYRASNKKSSQELQLTLIFVFCCPLNRQMQTNFNADNLKPWALKLPKSCPLGEQLKTFDKWLNKVPKYFPLSAVLFHFWINIVRHCCMLQTFLKTTLKFIEEGSHLFMHNFFKYI